MTSTSAPNPLKIVHIASGDLWAGAEVQIYYLLKELHKAPDISVSAILLNHGTLEEKLRREHIKVTVLDESALGSLQILRGIIRLLQSEQPDLVHTHRLKENVLGSIGARAAGVRHCVRTIHGGQERSIKPWQILKLSYALADRLCGYFLQSKLIAVSEELANRLSRQYPSRKLVFIENGVDIAEIEEQSKEVITLPGDPSAIKIAFVGRLVPVKRLDIFMEIAASLANESGHSINFYIIGDGPLHEVISKNIHARGLDNKVFLMGFAENIAAFIARMDLLLLTSDHEGTPMTILEAQALSVSVVAHAVGGIPAMLADYKFGYMINNQRPEEYILGINSAIDQRTKNQAANNNIHANSLSTYTSHACMLKHKTLYNAICQ